MKEGQQKMKICKRYTILLATKRDPTGGGSIIQTSESKIVILVALVTEESSNNRDLITVDNLKVTFLEVLKA